MFCFLRPAALLNLIATLLRRANSLLRLDVDERSERSVPLVRLASRCKPEWILDLFPERVKAEETVAWNREGERVEQVNSLKYDELTLDESRSQPTDLTQASRMLTDKALEAGLGRLASKDEIEPFLARVRFASQHSSAFPAEEADLTRAALEELARGLASFNELRRGSFERWVAFCSAGADRYASS